MLDEDDGDLVAEVDAVFAEVALMTPAERSAEWRRLVGGPGVDDGQALDDLPALPRPRSPLARRLGDPDPARPVRLRRPRGSGGQSYALTVAVPLGALDALPVLAAAVDEVRALLAERAREAAAEGSWAAVGAALGITRQAAHKRFGAGA